MKVVKARDGRLPHAAPLGDDVIAGGTGVLVGPASGFTQFASPQGASAFLGAWQRAGAAAARCSFHLRLISDSRFAKPNCARL